MKEEVSHCRCCCKAWVGGSPEFKALGDLSPHHSILAALPWTVAQLGTEFLGSFGLEIGGYGDSPRWTHHRPALLGVRAEHCSSPESFPLPTQSGLTPSSPGSTPASSSNPLLSITPNSGVRDLQPAGGVWLVNKVEGENSPAPSLAYWS